MNDFLQVNSRKKAVLFLLLAALMWSTGGLFIKYVQWSSLAIAGTRALVAALMIAFFLPWAAHLPENKYIWLCSFAYAGMCSTLVAATKLTTAANAIFLQYTAPIYVALITLWLFKERLMKRDLLIIGATAFGMTLFFIGEFSLRSIAGNLLGIISGICFAVMVVGFRYIKGAEPCSVAFTGNILIFIFTLPFFSAPLPDFSGWLALFYLGAFQIGLSYIIYIKAVVHVSSLEGVIIPTIEPILNPVWVFLFIGERPSEFAVLGGLIVLFVVTFYCIRARN